MTFEGYAYKSEEKTKQLMVRNRFEQIKHLARKEHIEWRGGSTYIARKTFRGTCISEEAKRLSDFDLLILADGGNLCFGGCCTKHEIDGTFFGQYYTD